MALLGNYNTLNANPGRSIGGPTDLNLWRKTGTVNLFYGGDMTVTGTNKSSFANGYTPPYSWNLAPKSGGLGANNTISGAGELNFANLAGGLNAEAPLTGSGDITNAALALVLSAVAALTGSGTLSADIIGKLEAVADLTGSGDLTAALGALASVVGALTGSGTISSAGMAAFASMSAGISVTGGTLTAGEVAAAVWDSIAADFNDAGTMGNKMNSAASAGDPWTTALPGAYADGTAGQIVGQKLLSTAKFLGLKQ